jgi:hypothetical protein
MPNTPDDRKRRAKETLADTEIVRRLSVEDFDPRGPTWGELSKVLVTYGYSVLIGMLLKGTIYRAAANHGAAGVRGLARIPRELRLSEDDAHELTATLLESAIPRFRLTLRDGQWHADGGASLTTFFVGRCLMDLPDVYERWRRQQDRWAQALDVCEVDDGRLGVDPSDAALASTHLDELLPPKQFEHERVMLRLWEYGYTYDEISVMFIRSGKHFTPGAVRTRISRAKKLAQLRNQGRER